MTIPAALQLIAIGGLSGTGKSVLARALAPTISPQPGAVVLRTDVLRKQFFRVNETDRLPESAYEPDVTEQIYALLVQRTVGQLSQGHSVIVDAVFAQEAERHAIREAARQLSLRFVGLFLATPEIAGLQEKYNIGALDWADIDASGTLEQTLQRCQARIAHCETA
jgi:predicted kinase